MNNSDEEEKDMVYNTIDGLQNLSSDEEKELVDTLLVEYREHKKLEKKFNSKRIITALLSLLEKHPSKSIELIKRVNILSDLVQKVDKMKRQHKLLRVHDFETNVERLLEDMLNLSIDDLDNELETMDYYIEKIKLQVDELKKVSKKIGRKKQYNKLVPKSGQRLISLINILWNFRFTLLGIGICVGTIDNTREFTKLIQSYNDPNTELLLAIVEFIVIYAVSVPVAFWFEFLLLFGSFTLNILLKPIIHLIPTNLLTIIYYFIIFWVNNYVLPLVVDAANFVNISIRAGIQLANWVHDIKNMSQENMDLVIQKFWALFGIMLRQKNVVYNYFQYVSESSLSWYNSLVSKIFSYFRFGSVNEEYEEYRTYQIQLQEYSRESFHAIALGRQVMLEVGRGMNPEIPVQDFVDRMEYLTNNPDVIAEEQGLYIDIPSDSDTDLEEITPRSRRGSIDTPRSRRDSMDTPRSRRDSMDTPRSRKGSMDTPRSRRGSIDMTDIIDISTQNNHFNTINEPIFDVNTSRIYSANDFIMGIISVYIILVIIQNLMKKF